MSSINSIKPIQYNTKIDVRFEESNLQVCLFLEIENSEEQKKIEVKLNELGIIALNIIGSDYTDFSLRRDFKGLKISLIEKGCPQANKVFTIIKQFIPFQLTSTSIETVEEYASEVMSISNRDVKPKFVLSTETVDSILSAMRGDNVDQMPLTNSSHSNDFEEKKVNDLFLTQLMTREEIEAKHRKLYLNIDEMITCLWSQEERINYRTRFTDFQEVYVQMHDHLEGAQSYLINFEDLAKELQSIISPTLILD